MDRETTYGATTMFDDLWLVPHGKKKLVLPYEARPDASPIRAAQAFTVSFVSRWVDEALRRGAAWRVFAGLRELPLAACGGVIATSDER